MPGEGKVWAVFKQMGSGSSVKATKPVSFEIWETQKQNLSTYLFQILKVTSPCQRLICFQTWRDTWHDTNIHTHTHTHMHISRTCMQRRMFACMFPYAKGICVQVHMNKDSTYVHTCNPAAHTHTHTQTHPSIHRIHGSIHPVIRTIICAKKAYMPGNMCKSTGFSSMYLVRIHLLI